ncbi:hypothetical protein CALVIDRAFT_357400 [Calocera viscosa TUFC12733]|uniref:Uncharacterized protein n=1 Tax=Calocera viscosa (strain TUFC12733) TaxID=1330018 RepID=A0A167QF82_CALVF|nr:hypothetical protein CALVIDRAFT_357400 [Calocera viscosa TUFC12733]
MCTIRRLVACVEACRHQENIGPGTFMPLPESAPPGTGMLFACIYSGMHEWTNASDDGTVIPTAVRVVYWIAFAIIVAVYFLGFHLRPGTFKGTALEANADAQGSDESVGEKDRDAINAA